MGKSLLTNTRMGHVSFGIYLSDTNPMMVEIAAYAGFDFMRIDCEHTLLDPVILKSMIQTASAVDVPTLVRISSLEEITKILDFGASGVLIPDVETKEQAHAAVNLCKYAPQGMRGMTTTSRCVQYGNIPIVDYIKSANENTSLGIQIESREGLDNLDEILSVEGIDIVAVGRQDLSQSLGVPGQTGHPMVKEAEEMVIRKTLEYGKTPLGTTTTPKQFEEMRKLGVLITTICYDNKFILQAYKDFIAKFKI